MTEGLIAFTSIDEYDPAYWACMAFSLQRYDKPEKAEKYYKKALELDPDNPIYLINLGYVLSEQQKNEEAINDVMQITYTWFSPHLEEFSS